MDRANFHRLPGWDANGNPRYVCHFLHLLTKKESAGDTKSLSFGSHWYDIAARRANSVGGRKYKAKWYGGGIVFAMSVAEAVHCVEVAIAAAELKEVSHD